MKLITITRIVAAVWLGLFVGLQPAAAQQADNKGTEFVLGFMLNLAGAADLPLFITGDAATSGMVEVPSVAFSQPFAVIPGTITQVNVPLTAEVVGSDVTTDQGILVTADDEIVVYGLNHQSFTTDAFLGLPTDILNTDYVLLGYQGLSVIGFFLQTEFLVVGVEDATTVTITPSFTSGARTAGVPYNITLNRLETYQLQGDDVADDVSGTTVTSDKPVAVFAGSICPNIPPSVESCDHVVEMIPPTATWGTDFVTVPLATRAAGDIFRIAPSNNATNIAIDGVPVATINRGQFHEVDLASGTFHEINTSGPVLVMQYSKGILADDVDSDPFQMMITPTAQFLDAYTLATPAATPVMFDNFINLAVPTADVPFCMIDGGPLTAAFTPIGASGFSGGQEPVGIGAHDLDCPNGFGAFSYGFSFADSYGYPGGMALDDIAVASDCAIIGDTDVTIQPGTVIEGGSVCSNGDLTTAPKVTVGDPDATDFDVKALGDMKLGEHTQISKDALANGHLYLKEEGTVYNDAHSGRDLRLGAGAFVVGTCYFDGAIDLGPKADCGVVNGVSPVLPLDPFDLPACEVDAPGGQNIKTQPKTGCHTLEPGDYGHVRYGPENCVVLSGGDYSFTSLTVGPESTFEIQGPSTLAVEERLLFREGVIQTLTNGTEADEVIYEVNNMSTTHKARAKTEIFGTICGPQAYVTLGDGTIFEGAIFAKEILVGAKVQFTAAPADLP